ncbi:hypothetical protein GCM10027293_02260 [Pontibacter aydingkolensis]|nr:hypothetical protein [Pontibacter aydingkolensis]
MGSSAVAMGAAGVALSFFPEEIGGYLGLTEAPFLLLQLLGALYFGFAMVNWTAKANLIGGIYSRPVALGNFAHFFVGGLALAKVASATATYTLAATILYFLFTALFGYVLFIGPAFKKKATVKV